MKNFVLDNMEEIFTAHGAGYTSVGWIDTEGDFRVSEEFSDDPYIENKVKSELREEIRETIADYVWKSEYLKFTGLDDEYVWDEENSVWKEVE